MFTANNKKKRYQWQTVEPQQKPKHKIQLVAGQYLRMYLILLTHLGSYTEPAGHLVYYSHLIWSHIGTKGLLIPS